MSLPTQPDRGRAFLFTLSLLGAIAVYLLWSALYIAQRPGLQYDEALMAVGPVHLLQSHGRAELPLPHDPHTWIELHHRWLPLMTVRYVGAVKEYLFLPLFAAFGPRVALIRMVAALLGALGIWGVGRLVSARAGAAAGLSAAYLIAFNPSYVDLTVFDNGATAAFMAALGLCALALTRYQAAPSARSAALLGLSLGFGIWARANFLWLAVAFAVALLLVYRTWRLMPLPHLAPFALGGILGGLPFLVYQVVSRGGTWQAIAMFQSDQSLTALLSARLKMLALTLVANAEHRAIWSGPAVPPWEYWLFSLVVFAAGLLSLAAPWLLKSHAAARPAQAAALTFFGYTALLFLSRLPVAEHHLAGLIPLAAVVVAFAFTLLASLWGGSALLAKALYAVVLAVCVFWLSGAVMGLGQTGGVGQWSDAISNVARELDLRHRGRQVVIADWGLADNLYVLSSARIPVREVYEQTLDTDSWLNAFRNGGLFLVNGPANRHFPASTVTLLDAVARVGAAAHRTPFPQRNGEIYAELIEVSPVTVDPSTRRGEAPAGAQLLMNDPAAASRLVGFHQIEAGGWRWTSRNFSVTLNSPDRADRTPLRLVLSVYVPDIVTQHLGAVTLSAQVGGHALAPATWSQTGSYTFVRDIEPGWLTGASNRIAFTLDKALPPSAGDRRELGVIATSVSLEPR